MKIIPCLLLFFFGLNSYAQDCISPFVENVEKEFKTKGFNKKFYKAFSVKDSDQIKIISVPVIFVTKEGADLFSKKVVGKNKLLCYLNSRKLQFDESFVYTDSVIRGVLCRVVTNYGVKYEWNEDTSMYVNLIRPLMIKVRDIVPDCIFRIYNLPQCYWYIKQNQLFVLYYKHEESGIVEIMTTQAQDYIKDHLKNEDLVFLYYKRVEIVSGF